MPFTMPSTQKLIYYRGIRMFNELPNATKMHEAFKSSKEVVQNGLNEDIDNKLYL